MSDYLSSLEPAVRQQLRLATQPDWTGPMLATLTDRRFSHPDWLFERKLDGERCLAFARAGRVTLKSRNGNIVSGAHPEIVAALERLRTADDFIADGEIVARHPRFEGLRTDREAQDVVRERPAG